MPPKKIVEKANMTLDIKPKRSVRKKTPASKSLLGEKLNMPTLTDMLIPNDHNQDPEIAPQKITKPKLAKEVNVNGITPSKARRGKINKSQVLCEEDQCITITYEAPSDIVQSENGPQKIKRRRIVKKLKCDNQGDEGADVMPSPGEVLQKNNTRKVNKQNLSHPELIPNDEVSAAPQLPDCIPTKVRKPRTPRIKKQNPIIIKIPIDTAATAPDISQSEEVPKVRRRRPPVNKQNLKSIETTQECDIQPSAEVPPESPEKVTPKIKRRKPTAKQSQNNEFKIMLANEVIRNAFKKNPPLVPLQRKPRRPARKKAVCITDDEQANNEPNTLLEDAHDASQELSICEPSETEVVPKKRRKLSLKRRTPAATDQTSPNTSTVKECKAGTQESTQVDSNANSLVPIEPSPPIAPDSTTKTDHGTPSQNTYTNKVIGRKNSDTSSSTCFSWTKDISVSSTTTCVTVKSSDFVRFDKKLPIVMLTNVDHQLKSVDNIIEENTFDSPIRNNCPSEYSSVSMANLKASQTLNLSTSSLTSVPSTNAQNKSASKENKNKRLIKLQRSLENLSSKMKNFDLEIMNWIGYENENENAQIKNFHARIFEDLNYENEVIKYCKEIKRVLTEDHQESTAEAVECPQQNEETCPEPVAKNSVTDNPLDKNESVKENNDMFNTAAESQKQRDTEDPEETDCDEMFNESKSFDKNFDVVDNDDDDALSLFAESITGLESSRKNSSFAVSVCDKSATPKDIGETLGANERVTQPITVTNDNKEVAPQMLVINDVKKQTADSSTVVRSACDSDVINKFQKDTRRPITFEKHFDDNFYADNFSVCYEHFSDIAPENVPNKTLSTDTVEFPNEHVRSPNDNCENSSNRSTELQNYKDGAPSCSINNSFNMSQEISGIPGDTSENWNDRTSFTQPNYISESLEESENNTSANQPVGQYDRWMARQLHKACSKMYHVPTVIFKGVCVFNLVSKCKNLSCKFNHIQIDVDHVRSMLQGMNEQTFLLESIYIYKWFSLMRKFGRCFVDECIRRNMTVLLLHLVKMFASKVNRNDREEEAFITDLFESTLLHLNEADLSECAGVLRARFPPPHGPCLCDLLIKAISETQNFARFKQVFLKLTSFVCRIGRTFRLDAATQLLERLCILPHDDALARALLAIIERTNPTIFALPMMRFLEGQLAKLSPELHEELQELRRRAERRPAPSPAPAPPPAARHASTPIARAPSPDTTNMDYLNKTSEPVITRTITINRTIHPSHLQSGSESSEERPERLPWRYRGVPRRGHMRPGFAPRAFNGAIPKFRRRPPSRQEPY